MIRRFDEREKRAQLAAFVEATGALAAEMRARSHYAHRAADYEKLRAWAAELLERGFDQARLDELSAAFVHPVYPHPKADGDIPYVEGADGRPSVPPWFDAFERLAERAAAAAGALRHVGEY